MINVGVVGCGYWGPNLIRNFYSLDDVCVKRICDKDQARLSHLTRIFQGLETTTDYNDLIQDKDIDAIAVATPVSTHFNLAKASIDAGKHTFIEKPMANSVSECKALIELAKKKRRTLMVGHTFIYTAAVRRIKQIVKNGDMGDILYISTRRLNLGLFQKDINVVWDLAPHDISIILYLIDKKPVTVNCQGKSHVNPGIEDVSSLSLDFGNGEFAMIHSSWLDPNKVREMIIVGSKRMIVYDDMQPLEKIKIYDKRVEMPPHYDTFAEFHYAYHYGDMYSPYIKQDEPLKVECQHFINSIQAHSKPETGGEEGLAVVQILEAANRSLKEQGNRIELKEL